MFKTTPPMLKIHLDEWQLFAFLAVYLVAWTLLAAWLPLSMDNKWFGHEQRRGYYKHPPLPSLLMYCLTHLFGTPSMGLSAFAAQGGNVIALLYVWLLAKRMLPPQLAIVAVLITTLIGYHNFRAIVFNHNTVSLPFTAAVLYYFYCAVRQPERLWMWMLLGVAGGLAMLTKYSAILVLASCFIYVVWQRLWINRQVLWGLLLSVLVFCVVFSPNIIWLIDNDWLPFTYLDKQLTTSGERLKLLGNFFANQGIRCWYALVAVWLLANISPRKNTAVELADDNNDRRFLLTDVTQPLIFAILHKPTGLP